MSIRAELKFPRFRVKPRVTDTFVTVNPEGEGVDAAPSLSFGLFFEPFGRPRFGGGTGDSSAFGSSTTGSGSGFGSSFTTRRRSFSLVFGGSAASAGSDFGASGGRIGCACAGGGVAVVVAWLYFAKKLTI